MTTTSYAILGLLAIQPWSTYALTKELQRGWHYLLRRAESNLYAEPKRLVEAGLAAAETEHTGKRERTLYTITPAGREALIHWLGTQSAPSRCESEAMVKVMLSPFGTKEDLLANLRQLAAEASTDQAFCQTVAEQYLRGDVPFPERMHVNALFYRWIWEQAETKSRWAEWAISQVESWPDTAAPADAEASLAVLREPFESPRATSNR